MKHIKTLSMILAVALTFTACTKGKWGNCIKGKGPITQQVRTFDLFTEVDACIPATVYLTQVSDINQATVTIHAQSNLLEFIETEIVGDRLIIKTKKNSCFNCDKPIEIYVKTKEYVDIALTGSGEMLSTNTLTSAKLRNSIDGSGDMDLDLVVTILETDINGSGNVTLTGSTQSHDIDINGSGDVRSFNLSSDDAEVDVNGSGSTEISVENNLDVQISGSGDVTYKGRPAVSTDINGSGNVRHAD